MVDGSSASRHGHADAAGPGQSASTSTSASVKTSGRQGIVSFECSGCQRPYHVPEKYAGRTVRCKKCDAFTVIPISGGPDSDMEDSELNELSDLNIDMDNL